MKTSVYHNCTRLLENTITDAAGKSEFTGSCFADEK
jgi:hypothetical protein